VKFAFAGDRVVAVRCLEHVISTGARPEALLVSDPERATHAEELITLCDHLPPSRILVGPTFRSPAAMELLCSLCLDFLIGVHFPYLLPREVLEMPTVGVTNLHPAFLPFNRGWHTPSWALLDGTPIGATLHFMDEGIDTGDIIHQRQLYPTPADTAHTLYGRIMALEVEVFREAWPSLVAGTFSRLPQDPTAGTFHVRNDLGHGDVQRIDPDLPVVAGDLLQKLKALTTNRTSEAAFFEMEGKRYRVQVKITAETEAHE
jgi:methionyl-tRNA formyltransferase